MITFPDKYPENIIHQINGIHNNLENTQQQKDYLLYKCYCLALEKEAIINMYNKNRKTIVKEGEFNLDNIRHII